MTDVPATYFDPRTSEPRPVRLRWHTLDQVLEVKGEGLVLRVPHRQVTLEPRLGREPRHVRFAHGGRCQIPEQEGVDAIIATWPLGRSDRPPRGATATWVFVAAFVIALVVLAWAIVQFGLPWAARRVAFMLPANITRALGDQALASLDRTAFGSSKLTAERQLELQTAFRDFVSRTGDATAYQIEFRSSNDGAPNAFALPSGTIVITDELVRLAQDDREIIGVLAHECAHVQQRHALRAILQSSALLVAVALATGDISSSSAVGGTLPTYLLQSRFPRAFEREADEHAIAQLRRAGHEPRYLAQMLARLAQTHGENDSKLLGYLGSHPPTRERIRHISGER